MPAWGFKEVGDFEEAEGLKRPGVWSQRHYMMQKTTTPAVSEV